MSLNNESPIFVQPTGAALGAEVLNVDLRGTLPAAMIAIIKQAMLDHCALFFRNQQITEQQQVDFTKHFGPAVPHVRKQPDRPVKEIFVVSNVKKNGEEIGALGNTEIGFHSDLSYLKKPGTYSLLYAVEIPRVGGNTQWINSYAAYDALDDDMKQRLDGLRAVHRHYVEEQNPPELVDHPVVRTHPESGRQCLYVGPHLTKSIVGLSDTEGRAILDRLFEHQAQPQFIWTHDWQIGDLVIWDNRPTLHRRLHFPPTERRLLLRTQVYGDEIPV